MTGKIEIPEAPLGLLRHQTPAVNELLEKTLKVLRSGGRGGGVHYVFKAPTGSGKTTMMGDLLRRLAGEQDDEGRRLIDGYVFLWGSIHDLHLQSKRKLSYLQGTYELLELDQLSPGQALAGGSLLFFNWHSLTSEDGKTKKHKNKAVRGGDYGSVVPTVLEATRQARRKIVLIVDESHRNYNTAKTQGFIEGFFKPLLTFEVSATPLFEEVTVEAEQEGTAYFTRVTFPDTVEAQLIKKKTLINASIGEWRDVGSDNNERVLGAALARRQMLEDAYREEGSPVRPLILVQLPSEAKDMSELDKGVRGQVEAFLKGRGITYENGRLALRLVDEKRNFEGVEALGSPVEVLIFKTACAVGWDCPRAQILVMLREMKSLTFQIQTVGRILRMPQARHYTNEDLNLAYAYTNIQSFKVDNPAEDNDFFGTHQASLKEGLVDIRLPNFHKARGEGRGDLGGDFIKVLYGHLNKHFDITDEGPDEASAKVGAELDMDPGHLVIPLLADEQVEDWDAASAREPLSQEELDGALRTEGMDNDGAIGRVFDDTLRSWTSPWSSSADSTDVLRQCLYRWFKKALGEKVTTKDVQRLIACSPRNRKILQWVVRGAKEEHKAAHAARDADEPKKERDLVFSLGTPEQYGDSYREVESPRCAYEPCFLLPSKKGKGSSKGEGEFVSLLDGPNTSRVVWWAHNRVNSNRYLGIEYWVVGRGGAKVQHTFYPDFLVLFADETEDGPARDVPEIQRWTLGIYDIKSGFTEETADAGEKADALVKYVDDCNQSGRFSVKYVERDVVQHRDFPLPRLDGGIVTFEDGTPHICRTRPFSPYHPGSGAWVPFTRHKGP
jgi:type III restriction enzyme